MFLLPAAHAGSLLSWKGTVTGNEKTLKAWFSVCAHALSGKEPKLKGFGVASAHTVTRR